MISANNASNEAKEIEYKTNDKPAHKQELSNDNSGAEINQEISSVGDHPNSNSDAMDAAIIHEQKSLLNDNKQIDMVSSMNDDNDDICSTSNTNEMNQTSSMVPKVNSKCIYY